MPLKDSLLRIFNLAQKTEPAEASLGIPLGMKSTPELVRIQPQELELDYLNNPVIFNGINKLTQIIMSTSRTIEAKDPQVAEFFNKFVNNVGYSGGETSWDDILEVIFKHQMIYGSSWVEKIHNKKGNRIVDLDYIDPKKMDYARAMGDKIALDRQGNPIGYMETVPPTVMQEIIRRFVPPEGFNILLQANQIFFPADRLAHFQLYTVGDGFQGIGLIEPIHLVSTSKSEMQKALVNAIWRAGFPTPVLSVGDEHHEPTTEQVRNMWDKLKKMNYKFGFSMPYYNKLEFLEPKHPERLQQHLDYFINQEVTGLGMAKAFATGTGEQGTNRAILTRQEYILKLTLKDIIFRTTKKIEGKIFRPIAQLEGFKEIPKLKWGEVVLQELDSKAIRITDYAKTGLIRPDEALEKYIRRMEDLPEKS